MLLCRVRYYAKTYSAKSAADDKGFGVNSLFKTGYLVDRYWLNADWRMYELSSLK